LTDHQSQPTPENNPPSVAVGSYQNIQGGCSKGFLAIRIK
jgi:hypothetical protein